MSSFLLRQTSCVLFTLAFLRSTAVAQTVPPFYTTDEPAVASKEGKVLRALRVAGRPPVIDGHLDDEVWTLAEEARGFVQWDPDNEQPMTESTIMQVAYDDRFLYVAMRCLDRTPDQIARGLGRRDETLPTDYVAVGFDPRHDHQTGYTFFVNPSGVQRDMSFYDDTNTDQDFNAVWDARTSIDDAGWIVEYRIPFSQIRFKASPAPGQVWGFSGRRTIKRRSESGEWVGRPRGEQGIVSRFGHLVFDTPLTPARRLEIQPYVLSGGTFVPDQDGDVTASTGADVRLGLGTSATLSATINPDFAQVEQDPAVLNLTVFETFFPEKRPFFLEDARTFVPPYGLFQLFHSRRIGDRPDRIALQADDDEVDRPAQTTILGAVKLTGKGGGWTYGAMSAATAREFASVRTGVGFGAERQVEPFTSYNVVRLQRDVRGGSNVGAIATAAVREQLPDAMAAGADFNLRWDRNRINWNGHWAATRAPDRGGVLRSGVGGVSNFNFNRKHGGFGGHVDLFSPQFRVEDLGFFRSRRDRISTEMFGYLEQPDPWKVFRRMFVNLFAVQAETTAGLRLARLFGNNVSFQFRNFWEVEAGYNHELAAYDDLDTRGGPPILVPPRTFGYIVGSTDSRKTWQLNVFSNWRRDSAGGWEAAVEPNVSLQPSTRLQVSFSARYERALDIAQWIDNLDATGDGVVDHIYGRLDRDVVDVTVRSTFAVNRDLTIQMYLQPFVAVGAYGNIRRLARPMSFDFEPVPRSALEEDPDFSDRSLRGNMVLRWEYKPGSTLFVAWNMSGEDDSRPGVFRGFRDVREAFGVRSTHAILVKASYWFNR
jgi:hypothetical protein